ncbi:unnamed protein product [Tenebrio molitor]|nr:unnamed protein product [Tenebrio molitor]
MKISTCIVTKVLQELIWREVEQDLRGPHHHHAGHQGGRRPRAQASSSWWSSSWSRGCSSTPSVSLTTSNWEYYPFSFFPIHALAMSFTCYNPFLYAWLNENVCKEFKESCQPEGRLGEWRFECKATARFRIVGSWESTF